MRLWLPRIDRTRRVLNKVLTVNQVRKFILSPDITSPRGYQHRCLFLTQYSAGLRASELMGMTTEAVDENNETITVTRKGGDIQELPVGELGGEYLGTYLDEIRLAFKPTGNHLWCNRDGSELKYTQYRRIVKKHMASLNLDFSSHDLRRAAATHLVKAKAPILGVARFLNHRNIDSTKVYLKIFPQELRKAVDRLGF